MHSHFNEVQSRVMDAVLNTDRPIVVSAPTGSGKTVLFELAIVRLLMNRKTEDISNDFKIIYVAPLKALCTERFTDWNQKFQAFKLRCIEVTGDTNETIELVTLEPYHIILVTPEKWDSLTRRWRSNCTIMHTIQLFLLDEIHIVDEERRGATVELIVSRMKTLAWPQILDATPICRFIAVSATIPNIEDIARWLGGNDGPPALIFKIANNRRPIKLIKHILGYDCPPKTNDFRFDMTLNYKLSSIINRYAMQRPSLVFCTSRRGAEMAATVLTGNNCLHLDEWQRQALRNASTQVDNEHLRLSIVAGIGLHHAGLKGDDRTIVENLFRTYSMPVLVCTSTLAMGINLPAYLVVIKSTQVTVACQLTITITSYIIKALHCYNNN